MKNKLFTVICLLFFLCLNGCRSLLVGTIGGAPTIAMMQYEEKNCDLEIGCPIKVAMQAPISAALHGGICYGLFIVNPIFFGLYLGASNLYSVFFYEIQD